MVLLAGGLSLLLAACGGGGGTDGPSPGGASHFANATQPFVDDLQLATTEGNAVDGQVTGFDLEGAPLFFSLSIEPSHGSVSGLPPGPLAGSIGSPTGFFTYTPDPGFVGLDSFKFTANDGDWNSRKGKVAIQVRPAGFAGKPFSPDGRAGSVAGQSVSSVPVGSAGTIVVVRHALPEGHHALYALDTAGLASPVLIADSRHLGALSGAFTVPGGRVFFRADGALMSWFPGEAQPIPVLAGSSARATLGEVVLSGDGHRLAFVSGPRGSGRQTLFLVNASEPLVSVILSQPSSRQRWIRNLRFVGEGLMLRFDVIDPLRESACAWSVQLDPNASLAFTATAQDEQCQPD